MQIVRLIKDITSHELNKKNKTKAVLRFIRWQLNTRLNPYPIIYPFTTKSKLIIQKGLTGATGNLYCGLQEFNDMAFLLHLLRENDYFVDIGANIGSYTVLASAHVGANTISIEPVPNTFLKLVRNISVNGIYQKVKAYNIAIGSHNGFINFTSSLDTMNHAVKTKESDTIEVPIEKLDDILNDRETPVLLKIDVEGFETEVIRGAAETLNKSELKAIIIELNGSGLRYGYEEQKIHETLTSLNFKPFQYDPLGRTLNHLTTYGIHNTIYIRDENFVKQRLETAEKIKILNQEI